jgi:hypothetical protein
VTHRRALAYVEIDIPSFGDSPDIDVTYRFAQDSIYLPITDPLVIPSILDINSDPAIISLGEDLGQRASITVKFRDHKHIFDGESFDSGSFWGKFRARYGLKLQGKPLRLIQGFLGQDIDNMETRLFSIESTDGPSLDGEFKIIAKDLFKLVDGDRAQAPVPSNGFLSANITNVATTMTLLPSGVGNDEYPASGYINIGGKEIVSFTRSGDTFTITRAQYNTTAQAHDSQSRAQLCLRYNAVDPADILIDLLITYGGIDGGFITEANWQAETAAFLTTLYSALITEPTSVNKLISEIIEQAGLALWWDDIDQQFRLQVLRAVSTASATYSGENIMQGSLKVTE